VASRAKERSGWMAAAAVVVPPADLIPHAHVSGDQLGSMPRPAANLELTRTQRDGQLQGSLLWVVGSHHLTPWGAAGPARWIEQPLRALEADPCRRRPSLPWLPSVPCGQALRRLLRRGGSGGGWQAVPGRASRLSPDLVPLADGLERLPQLGSLLEAADSPPLRGAPPSGPRSLAELAASLRHSLQDSGASLSLSEGCLIH